MRKLFTASERLFLVVICVLNFSALLIGLNGDSPFAFESDEWDYGPHAVWMLTNNDFNPHWFANPASTIYYPLLAYYSMLRAVYPTQIFDSTKDETRITFEHMTLLIKVPRFVDLLLTVGTLPLIYLVGRKWLGKEPALIATIMFAVCPEAIRWGQTLRTDALTDFLIVLGMLCVTHAVASPERRSYAIWGACITALATSTRYFGLALAAPFITTYALSFWQSRERKPLINLVLFLILLPVLFFCFSPFVFLDFQQAFADLRYEAFSELPGISGFGLVSNSLYYANEVMPFCFGWILTVAVPIGLVLAIIKKQSNLTVALITMLIGFWIGTCLNSRQWYRWLMPMVPGFSMLAGLTVFMLFQQLERGLKIISPPSIARSIALATVSLLVVASLAVPLANDYLLEIDKMRYTGAAQMWKYIRTNIPAGTKIAVDASWGWTGIWLYDVQKNVSNPDPNSAHPKRCASPLELAQEGCKYVICSEWSRRFYLEESSKYPVQSQFFSELSSQARLIYATKQNTETLFGVNPYNRNSAMEIYDLRPLARGSLVESGVPAR